MVQPKQPPLSVRLGQTRLAAVDDYAIKHGVTRHAAVTILVDAGLKALGPPLSITSDYAKRVEDRVAKGGFKPQATPFVEHMDKAKPSAKPKAKPAVGVSDRNGPLKRLKPSDPVETVGSLVNVPLHKPKAFNPQPKKGTKK